MRKLFLTLLAFFLLLLGALLPLVLPRPCPVNREACERVKEGMTQEEVYAIMGGPPGDYRTRPAPPTSFAVFFCYGAPHLIEEWKGDTGTVTVDYQCRITPGAETVLLASFEEAKPSNPGLVELVRWRLGRLKERLTP